RRVHVRIYLNPNERSIRVIDNAAGIALEDFPRAFRPAEPPPDARGLSEFGMGMKSAACWFSPKWKVRTKAASDPVERTIVFDIDKIVTTKSDSLPVAEEKVGGKGHYTEIRLTRIKNFPATRTQSKMKEHLVDIYRC